MPSPYQFSPPSALRQLTCPNCFRLMRVTFIDADDDGERIKFICEDCRIEEILNNQSDRVT
jgi:hypothetical protein